VGCGLVVPVVLSLGPEVARGLESDGAIVSSGLGGPGGDNGRTRPSGRGRGNGGDTGAVLTLGTGRLITDGPVDLPLLRKVVEGGGSGLGTFSSRWEVIGGGGGFVLLSSGRESMRDGGTM
jgi:hypothetical protein